MELSSHNSVAVLAFPPTAGYPRLTTAVLEELDDLLEEIQGAGLFSGVVIAANAKSFATGAEIEEVAAVEGVARARICRTWTKHLPPPRGISLARGRRHPWLLFGRRAGLGAGLSWTRRHLRRVIRAPRRSPGIGDRLGRHPALAASARQGRGARKYFLPPTAFRPPKL